MTKELKELGHNADKDEQNWLNLDESIGFNLNVLSNRFSLVLQSHYRKQHKLSVASWRLIATLAEKAPLSAREVAEYTVMDPIRVSRAVSDLLKRRLISRTTDPKDRRKVVLKLTKRGYDIYFAITPFVIENEQALYGKLTKEEQRTLLDLILKLEEHSRTVFGKVPD